MVSSHSDGSNLFLELGEIRGRNSNFLGQYIERNGFRCYKRVSQSSLRECGEGFPMYPRSPACLCPRRTKTVLTPESI
jgi:hypothetical protein